MATLTQVAGGRIRQARQESEWTLADLARATGLSVSHLSEVERGLASITLALLETLGTALALPPLWFVDLDNAEPERARRQYYARLLREIAALAAGGDDDTAL